MDSREELIKVSESFSGSYKDMLLDAAENGSIDKVGAILIEAKKELYKLKEVSNEYKQEMRYAQQ